MLEHLRDAWSRRHEPNVVLVHFDDLIGNLGREMRRLAQVLDIDVPAGAWPVLEEAATLPAMRARADHLAPNALQVLRDPSAFFRRGTSGAGAELASPEALERYARRAAALSPPDLLEWLHRAEPGRPGPWP